MVYQQTSFSGITGIRAWSSSTIDELLNIAFFFFQIKNHIKQNLRHVQIFQLSRKISGYHFGVIGYLHVRPIVVNFNSNEIEKLLASSEVPFNQVSANFFSTFSAFVAVVSVIVNRLRSLEFPFLCGLFLSCVICYDARGHQPFAQSSLATFVSSKTGTLVRERDGYRDSLVSVEVHRTGFPCLPEFFFWRLRCTAQWSGNLLLFFFWARGIKGHAISAGIPIKEVFNLLNCILQWKDPGGTSDRAMSPESSLTIALPDAFWEL